MSKMDEIPKNAILHLQSGLWADGEKGVVFGAFRKPIGYISKFGYVRARGTSGRIWHVHRVIWEAINGPIPKKIQINHINGIKTDNRISNLELMTNTENQRHAFATGLNPNFADNHSRARITSEVVTRVRASKLTTAYLARFYGVSENCIREARKGRTWRSVPMPNCDSAKGKDNEARN